MIAAGIDLGGTKIEAQVFADGWQVAGRRRIDTPKDYAGLVAAVADQVRWCEGEGGAGLPVGLGAAGMVNPATGRALAANIPVTGHAFPADIVAAAGRGVTHVNDCRAFALSEAIFGAAKCVSPAVGLILGTGTGGGVVVDGRLVAGPSSVGGEFGHMPLPAPEIAAHGLPVLACGCGRMACYETLVSGPGMTRIAEAVTGRALDPREVAAGRADRDVGRVWDIWCRLTAEMMMTLILTVDPAIFVIGGGLSLIDGVADDLSAALGRSQLAEFAVPPVVLAEGGETSGARGAAYAAWSAADD